MIRITDTRVIDTGVIYRINRKFNQNESTNAVSDFAINSVNFEISTNFGISNISEFGKHFVSDFGIRFQTFNMKISPTSSNLKSDSKQNPYRK